MAVAYVSAQSGNNHAPGSSSSITVTPGTAIAIGSLVVCSLGYQATNSTPSAPTISADSDSFVVATEVQLPGNGGLNFFFTTAYFINTTASHASVTANVQASSTFMDMTVNTFSGFGPGALHAAVAPLYVQTNQAGATADVGSSGNFAASVGDLLFAAVLDLNGNGTLSLGTTLAWQAAQAIASITMAEYILSSAATTVAATWGSSTSGNTTTGDPYWGVGAYSFTPVVGVTNNLALSLTGGVQTVTRTVG